LLDTFTMKLNDLPITQKAEIITIEGDSEKLQRLTELGLRSGKNIEVLQKTPFGGPIVIQVEQSIIALRSEEALCITLKLHL
jgi:Fe2+ transport system protein FeoA